MTIRHCDPKRAATTAGAATVLALVGMAGAMMLPGRPALAEVFVLHDGTEVDGTVVSATLNTFVILRNSGGFFQTPRDRIVEIRIPTGGSDQVMGPLVGWSDGVYELETDEGIIAIRADGTVVERKAAATAALEPAPTPPSPKPKQPLVVDLGNKSPTFVLGDESWVTGDIVAQAGQIVVIRLPLTGLRQIPLSSIRALVVTLSDGREIEGALDRWAGGAYWLRVEDEIVKVMDPNAIAADQEAGPESEAPASEAPANEAPASEPAPVPADEPIADRAAQDEPSEVEQAAAADEAESRTTGSAVTADEPDAAASGPETAAGGPEIAAGEAETATDKAEPTPEAGQVVAAVNSKPSDALPMITAELSPAAEGDNALVVTFQLSEPANKPVLIAYGSVNGTATAGVDYELQRGVLTIEPGQLQSELRVPLLNDGVTEGEKDFTLFLSTSPGVATLAEKRINAVIRDND